MTRDKTAHGDAAAAPSARKSPGITLLRFLRDLVVIVAIALLVSFLVKTFLVRSFFIPSGSMEDTLQIDDRILVDELTPRWNEYQRGEIVVFQDPGGWLPIVHRPARTALSEGLEKVLNGVGLNAADSEDHLVKRIIGLPGDHVECCTALGQITINGSPIDESGYLKLPAGEMRASSIDIDVVVPDDAIWVLGDNRYRSQDSRFHEDLPGKGFVPLDNVVGRAFLITWPLDRFGTLDPHTDVFRSVRDPE